MKLFFSRFKYTENLFSKRLDTSIEILDDEITLNVFPHLAYCGKYSVLEVKKIFNMLRYITEFKGQIFYIDIFKGGVKVSVFNDRKEGVILKR